MVLDFRGVVGWERVAALGMPLGDPVRPLRLDKSLVDQAKGHSQDAVSVQNQVVEQLLGQCYWAARLRRTLSALACRTYVR